MSQRSFLDQLLDGAKVEWKAVEEIFDLRNGYTPSKSISEYWKDGTIPWFRMEDIRANGQILNNALQKVAKSALKGGKLFPANSIIVATSATIGEHALITVPYLSNQRFTNLILKTEYSDRFEIRFLFYYCFLLDDWCKNNTTMSSFASVDMNGFKKIQIPIPPLPAQEEIVRILDAFTELTTELASELSARKKQYNYYRDQLLSFEEGEVEWKTLGETCDVYTGGEAPESSSMSKTPTDIYKYPIFGNGAEVYGYTDRYRIDKDAVTISSIGANTGTIYFRKAHFTPIIRLKVVIPKQEGILPRYLFHALSSIAIGSKSSSVPNMNAADVKRISIPIPPLAEQERIVDILDKFDALTSSISEGLPREIELRQKQYEYYRELLLSFPKAEAGPK
ncbi:restriction endonuclease subunit S [Leptospira interrogans]|uniref:Type I restriction modification DNA specificity domain protein n=4 Tax=Leptospira interrogans TaxID=173 RepID=M6RIU5_LEPIR|nr:restriction endonuclease subunit S [Leptospira interrogans]EMG19233.1 type I restriction modification DNA specificity domain protein [Leptospira interrogans serovar Copenhageni str. LT2050]EMO07495.1 type I restriction modification DNA specificity domain protein [Leptospira interrogans serovar Icterohaemorrhagiae str. Verdun HP]OBZ98849.1 Type I restriction modification DNA specificity domain protein [Leptospira interrogans serovar Copenhageni/Icterohaemorrhagiae]AAS69542.1 type I restrictio